MIRTIDITYPRTLTRIGLDPGGDVESPGVIVLAPRGVVLSFEVVVNAPGFGGCTGGFMVSGLRPIPEQTSCSCPLSCCHCHQDFRPKNSYNNIYQLGYKELPPRLARMIISMESCPKT